MQHNYTTTELHYKLYIRIFDNHLFIKLVLSLGKHFAHSMWHTEYINLSVELGKNPLIMCLPGTRLESFYAKF